METQAGRSWWNSTQVAALVVGVVTALAYAPVLLADFVMWDDNWVVYANPHLHGLGSQALKEIVFNVSRSSTWYTPLAGLRFAALNQIWGLNPVPYHAANLIVHAVNAALVVVVIRELLRLGKMDISSAAKLRDNVALVTAALLWSLHPLRVEVVAWVSAGAHSQALFFCCFP
jgi:hypothetical protein